MIYCILINGLNRRKLDIYIIICIYICVCTQMKTRIDHLKFVSIIAHLIIVAVIRGTLKFVLLVRYFLHRLNCVLFCKWISIRLNITTSSLSPSCIKHHKGLFSTKNYGISELAKKMHVHSPCSIGLNLFHT